MGVMQAFSACVSCRRPFFYHPLRVPSITIQGTKEPICRDCVERVNPVRIRNGLAPIVLLPGAYDPMDEHEWPDDDCLPARLDAHRPRDARADR